MSIIIQGVAASSYVRTARMICVEKRLPHTLEAVDFGSAVHERAHPWKRVPIMKHGAVTLIETSAIARYLDEIGEGPSLLPATAVGRATMEQWISVINCYLYDTLIRGYALKYVNAMRANREPDREAIAAAVPAMERDLGRLDTAYAGKTHLVGDALSLADFFVAPIVATVQMFPEGKQALGTSKHLGRAFGAIAERESFGLAHAGLA